MAQPPKAEADVVDRIPMSYGYSGPGSNPRWRNRVPIDCLTYANHQFGGSDDLLAYRSQHRGVRAGASLLYEAGRMRGSARAGRPPLQPRFAFRLSAPLGWATG